MHIPFSYELLTEISDCHSCSLVESEKGTACVPHETCAFLAY